MMELIVIRIMNLKPIEIIFILSILAGVAASVHVFWETKRMEDCFKEVNTK